MLLVTVEKTSLKTKKVTKTFHLEVDGELSPAMTKKACLFIIATKSNQKNNNDVIQQHIRRELDQCSCAPRCTNESQPEGGVGLRNRDSLRLLDSKIEEGERLLKEYSEAAARTDEAAARTDEAAARTDEAAARAVEAGERLLKRFDEAAARADEAAARTIEACNNISNTIDELDRANRLRKSLKSGIFNESTESYTRRLEPETVNVPSQPIE